MTGSAERCNFKCKFWHWLPKIFANYRAFASTIFSWLEMASWKLCACEKIVFIPYANDRVSGKYVYLYYRYRIRSSKAQTHTHRCSNSPLSTKALRLSTHITGPGDRKPGGRKGTRKSHDILLSIGKHVSTTTVILGVNSLLWLLLVNIVESPKGSHSN